MGKESCRHLSFDDAQASGKWRQTLRFKARDEAMCRVLTSHDIDDDIKMLVGILINRIDVLVLVVDRLKSSQALHMQAVWTCHAITALEDPSPAS